MKKIITYSLFLAAFTFVITGCLKDKGFEKNQYGINDPDTQPPGVGFPLAANKKNTFGLDVKGTNQAAEGLVYVNLEAGETFSSDIVVTLALDSNLVKAYNTANGTSILVMKYTDFNLPSLTLTIPAGARNVQIPINVPSTLTFDPNKSYGVGISIKSVTNNLRIAGNLKDLLVEFTIKNKYDGKYNLKGYHNRPGLSNPYDETVLMITSGPASITMYWPALGNYAHPLNGGVTYYGSFTTNFYFNATTNALINWDTYPYPLGVAPSMGPATDSRYDPVTKKIYANFYYNSNPGARQFLDTLTYISPR